MTKREINLRIFQKKDVPEVLFQPRLETWYNWNKNKRYDGAAMPENYRDMTLPELYDDLGVSMRYIYAYWPWTYNGQLTEQVKVETKDDGNTIATIFYTPHGELVREQQSSSDGALLTTKFPIETDDDIERAIWLFENTIYVFNTENFDKGSEYIGDRGQPQFYVPRSGYQHLCTEWMGLENLTFGISDFPEKVERLMEAIDTCYDPFYEAIVAHGRCNVVNFGENIDSNIVSPRYFEKYCIPFYEKRARQLQAAGTFTHIHMDGSMKTILSYIKGLPFDAIEAITPLPQGDVTLEEMKEAIGDKILIDGIPAIYFLPQFSIDELIGCVERLVELFHPRLVLGVSDEVPPPSDIEKVRLVADHCCGLRAEEAKE